MTYRRETECESPQTRTAARPDLSAQTAATAGPNSARRRLCSVLLHCGRIGVCPSQHTILGTCLWRWNLVSCAYTFYHYHFVHRVTHVVCSTMDTKHLSHVPTRFVTTVIQVLCSTMSTKHSLLLHCCQMRSQMFDESGMYTDTYSKVEAMVF